MRATRMNVTWREICLKLHSYEKPNTKYIRAKKESSLDNESESYWIYKVGTLNTSVV